MRRQPTAERGPPSPRVLKGGRLQIQRRELVQKFTDHGCTRINTVSIRGSLVCFKSKRASSIRADMAVRAPMGSRQHVFTSADQPNSPAECLRSHASDVL